MTTDTRPTPSAITLPTGRTRDVVIHRPGGSADVLLVRGRFREAAFPPHFDESWVLGSTEEGAHHTWCGRHHHSDLGRDALVLVPPGEVHTGETLPNVAWSWRAFHLSPAWVERFLAGAGSLDRNLSATVMRRADAAAQALAAHVAFERGDDLEGEELLAVALRGFLASPPRPAARGGRETAPVATAHRYLLDNLHTSVTLAELCAVSGLDVFHLLRAFRRAYGVPPHRFLVGARVARARDLLARGVAPADVAADVGFCDQSHLNRHFARIVGVTPARYARAVAARR
jgi:AraC-like DNA-binding protein